MLFLNFRSDILNCLPNKYIINFYIRSKYRNPTYMNVVFPTCFHRNSNIRRMMKPQYFPLYPRISNHSI